MSQGNKNIDFERFGRELSEQTLLKNGNYKDDQKVAFQNKQMLHEYIRRIVNSESDILRRSIIPNFMDYGKFIDFKYDWNPDQLCFITANFEFATLNIFYTISKYENYDRFSFSLDTFSPDKPFVANVFWGLAGRDWNNGIIKPYATSISTICNNIKALEEPNSAYCAASTRLIAKLALVALPAWNHIEDTFDATDFEACLNESIEKNGQKAFHGYVDALYRQINISKYR